MGKLMIGSFGTLAAIAVINFKLQPMPELERSFCCRSRPCGSDRPRATKILRGMLQPAAIDLLNPSAGSTLGRHGWLLAGPGWWQRRCC